MEPKKDVVEKGGSVRDMHHLRLMSLLQELERDNGRKKAAEVLGVDRRTLDASLDEGVLTRRIRGALEKALQSGVGSAAAEQRGRNDRLADRLEDLEGKVEEQGKEMRANNRASEDRDRAIREEIAQGFRQRERNRAPPTRAGNRVAELRPLGVVAQDLTYLPRSRRRSSQLAPPARAATGASQPSRALAAVEKSTAKEWAKAQGYKRYLGSSVKGELSAQ